jgi:two-component system chemotaxis response regulator CheB
MFVVLHVPPTTSMLPAILTWAGALPAEHARDGVEFEAGRIYVAPPDYHLLLGERTMHLERGPRENGHRPAIDALFRSAAANHGERVTGVILSGTLDDGVAGLAGVKRLGGAAVVQDPTEALYPTMPKGAIAAGAADHVLPVAAIPSLLVELATTELAVEWARSSAVDLTQLDPETITAENRANGELTDLTCPECKGPIWELREGEIVKLRCRVGHTFSEDSFSREQALALDGALWTALTALVEKAAFSRRLSERFRSGGHIESARRYEDQSRNALEQADRVRAAIRNLEGTASERVEAS